MSCSFIYSKNQPWNHSNAKNLKESNDALDITCLCYWIPRWLATRMPRSSPTRATPPRVSPGEHGKKIQANSINPCFLTTPYEEPNCMSAPGQQRGLERSPDPKVMTMLKRPKGLGTQKNGVVGLEDVTEKPKSTQSVSWQSGQGPISCMWLRPLNYYQFKQTFSSIYF